MSIAMQIEVPAGDASSNSSTQQAAATTSIPDEIDKASLTPEVEFCDNTEKITESVNTKL